jgi:signal transduction histidine kinase
VFAILALAGGAGIALYAALWLYTRGDTWLAALPLLAAASLVLESLGLSPYAVGGLALITAGLVLMWWRGDSIRPGRPLPLAGILVAALGVVLLLSHGNPTKSILAPGEIAAGLLLLVGPWLWQLARERDAMRVAKIRSDERADVATRVHDSVLQTLALVQRHADDPRRIASLARRQERELREWLYGDGPATGDTLGGALAREAADIEELHGARIELASGGDCRLSDELTPLVLAAREAMANAAKFSASDEISVYSEATDDTVSVFVRDRGAGFDRSDVPADRKGLTESIEGRLERAGGRATITSAPGKGTEVELSIPRRAS